MPRCLHHTPQHSDAAVQALFDTGRRAAFGYFEGAGPPGSNPPNHAYPQDAVRIKKQYLSSTDQLVTMIMGGDVYLGTPTYTQSWTIGRQLGLQSAAHILSPFGIRPILNQLAMGEGGVDNNIGIRPDNLFIHITGMSNLGWKAVNDKGAQVSIAFPIEMNMRHGMPPILKMQSLGIEPSLSVDVECTLTADFFTQMRVLHELAARGPERDDPVTGLCARPSRLGTSGISTGCAERQSVAYPPTGTPPR